ncbi:aromatic hydrocarbon degradation protein [uncultured Acetobacteroides sp.]|uniref:OmpP1/FadL family transporter n=1 Tax=uncultured Acetobacteroides sp. TaxID=1760811 RepID=UPI0029F4D592|nr:aromatic hydrocarbon degradation protein [uncultured Acetobacteroides sp.]
MRRIVLLLALACGAATTNAGGILTSSNQSASYMRVLSRNASTDMDAVYYNPAGLTLLKDGFHLSLNNQTLFQKRTIQSDYPYLNNNSYSGDVTTPFFPTFFAAYKKDKLAIFGGFGPVGGGGGATFNNGLPSFETDAASIPTSLSQKGIPTTRYALDMSFDGSSVIYGGQLGASYKVNDWLSVSGGARLIYARNTYDGYIHDIRINPISAANPGGGFVNANLFFKTLATSAANAATSLQPLITNNAGGLTLAQAQAAGALTPAQVAQIQGGLGSNYNAAMTIAQIQATYNGISSAFTTNAAKVADKNVDVTQTGTGVTPIIGVNITPSSKLNIGVRYEFATKLKLKNDTKVDDTGNYTDGKETNSDLPAILAIGIDYRIIPDLKLTASLTHYFDKDANWDGKEKFITDNLYEFAVGMECNVSERILFSGGFMYIQTGAGQGYQSDISYSLSSHSVGFGAGYKITDQLTINSGMMYTQYVEGTRMINYTNVGNIKETYKKSNIGFSIGFDYRF